VLLVGVLVSAAIALNLVQNGRAETLERVDESMARVKVAFDGEMRRREDILLGVGVLWAAGEFSPATGPEADHLVYIAPEGNERARVVRGTGLDSRVLAQARQALERARESREPSASPPLGDGVGPALFLPVYRGPELRGWVGLLLGQGSLAEALRRSDPNPAARVELVDRGSGGPIAANVPAGVEGGSGETRTRSFEAYGREWVVTGRALPGAADSNYARESLVIMVLGSLMSVLLFLLMRVLSRSEERALRLADETVGRMLDLEERFRSLAATPVGIFRTDAEGAVLFSNHRSEELTGKTSAELAGRCWTEIVHPLDMRAVTAAWRGAKRGRSELGRQFRLAKAGSGERWVACRLAPLWGTGGAHTGWIGSLEDVSERREHEAELARRALHDPLTELPNRTYFLDRLSQAIERARRNRSRLAVMFVDLDQFKAVNDNLGHEAGDRVLVEVAQRLKGALRAGDTVARFGGDEFTVLCEDVTGSIEMSAAAGRIAAALASTVEVNGHEVAVGSSVGIAIGFGVRAEADELLRSADSAMYRAKAEATSFELVEEGAPGVRPA
jgi:diguanylate cyclase (GGDEF)-like protein/PAS domain S-box-containing protein